MKGNLLKILAVLLLVLVPLGILTVNYLKRLNDYAGDFNRLFPHSYSQIKGIDLKYNSFYIAGVSNEKVLLGNYTTLPRLFVLDPNLSITDTIILHTDNDAMAKRGHYKISIDSPNFYVFYGYEPALFKGSLHDWNVEKINLPAPYFIDCIPLKGNSLIFKYTSATSKHLAFRKVYASGKSLENDSILEVQVDGQFCTSGHLKYNKLLNVLVYVYAYRNQVLVIDTNLNLIRKFNTIDHIDTARFTVSQIQSSGSKVLTSPTILVNQRCALYKQYLLVNSKVRSKREDDTKFEYSTVIDIYDITNGRYVYSLSLPNPNKKNITQFEIINGYLYAIADQAMNRYKFELPN